MCLLFTSYHYSKHTPSFQLHSNFFVAFHPPVSLVYASSGNAAPLSYLICISSLGGLFPQSSTWGSLLWTVKILLLKIIQVTFENGRHKRNIVLQFDFQLTLRCQMKMLDFLGSLIEISLCFRIVILNLDWFQQESEAPKNSCHVFCMFAYFPWEEGVLCLSVGS